MKLKYIIILLMLYLPNKFFSQEIKFRTDYQMKEECKECHLCDTPTKANPCLILCPRNKIKSPRHSPSEGPEMIIIHKIKSDANLYGPSNFSHKSHAEMSLMSGGCSTCHHYNPPGPIVKCSYCHEENRIRKDLNKPDLKAAFHRQCLSCHETFMQDTDCEFCHSLISEPDVKPENKKTVHPEITMPVKIVYSTDYDEDSLVTFYHSDHKNFGFECSTCHSQTDCAKCHSSDEQEITDEDLHEKCSNCHDTDNDNKCNNCHSNISKEPFNHYRRANFDLQKYHNKLSCLSCHKSLKNFSGLNKECISCHQNSEGYFEHSITKLQLDENHVDFECENCHFDLPNFNKISCEECHDEINYPKNLPGKRIK